jgi:hypothetical protein
VWLPIGVLKAHVGAAGADGVSLAEPMWLAALAGKAKDDEVLQKRRTKRTTPRFKIKSTTLAKSNRLARDLEFN